MSFRKNSVETSMAGGRPGGTVCIHYGSYQIEKQTLKEIIQVLDLQFAAWHNVKSVFDGSCKCIQHQTKICIDTPR